MSSCPRLVVFVLVLLGTVGFASASNTDNHQVTVTVNAINELAVAGGDITLTINAAVPGSDPTDATDATTSLDWTSNQLAKKITAATNNATAVFALKVDATAVAGGTTAGQIVLSTTPADYVTGIAETVGGCTNSYTASATAAQGTGSEVHVVTFTLTDQ